MGTVMNQADRNQQDELENKLRDHFEGEAEAADRASAAWWSKAMAQTLNSGQEDMTSRRWFARRGFRMVAIPVAAALGLAVVVGAASLWTTAPWESDQSRDPGLSVGQNQDPEGQEPLGGGGTSFGMCIENYSVVALETLKDQENMFAFDGTVTSIERRANPDVLGIDQEQGWVTFAVNQWFKGGEGAEVGVWLSTEAIDDGTPVETGSRLLVAGEFQSQDDPLAWLGCGFTQGYNADVAQDWEQALS
jgi:hypothetical protein